MSASTTVTTTRTNRAFGWLITFVRDPAFSAALTAFGALRLITMIVAIWGLGVAPLTLTWKHYAFDLNTTTFTTQGPLRTVLEPWYRWDTGWYIYVAYYGYRPNDVTLAFPPLYPYAIRAVQPLIGDYLITALLISNVCSFLALYFLYKLVAETYGAKIARSTVFLFALCPSALFLAAGYSEPMFLMFGIAAWWVAQHQRYWLAGMLACLSALTRPQGWVFALPIMHLAVTQQFGSWRGFFAALRRPIAWFVSSLRIAPAIVGAPLGTAAYLFGVPLIGLGSIDDAGVNGWQSRLAPPWESVIIALQKFFSGQSSLLEVANLVTFTIMLVMLLLSLRKLKPDFVLYLAGTLFVLALVVNERIILEGMIRYVTHMFPMFITLALLLSGRSLRHRVATTVYYVAACGGLILLTVLFARFWWIG